MARKKIIVMKSPTEKEVGLVVFGLDPIGFGVTVVDIS